MNRAGRFWSVTLVLNCALPYLLPWKVKLSSTKSTKSTSAVLKGAGIDSNLIHFFFVKYSKYLLIVNYLGSVNRKQRKWLGLSNTELF